jgi:addiction module RelE/StbE family toxin
MKVVLAPQAREDLREILAYIAADNPRAARAVLARIRERILELRTHPHLGRPGRLPETRELVIPATPYVVPYQVLGRVVQVLRVYHGARRWPDRL